MPRLGDSRGQATIELLALLPLLVAAALAGAAIVGFAAAQEQAGEAAHAGAIALLQGDEDAVVAARAALPESDRAAATIDVSGRRIEVSLPPPHLLSGVLSHLAASASADAGPEPAP